MIMQQRKDVPSPFVSAPLVLGIQIAIGVCAPRLSAASDMPDVPLGGEVQVNVNATGNQFNQAIAMDADGDFVVVWRDSGQRTILARRFSSDGAPRDAVDLVVNLQPAGMSEGQNGMASVAMDADGDFVVAWESYDYPTYTSFFRRFSADGTPRDSSDILVSSTTEQSSLPSVAMDVDGDFIITWYGADSYTSLFRRFNADGTARDINDVQVNSTTESALLADVAIDADGDFVIVWESGDKIFMRRFTADGTALDNSDVQVNSLSTALYSSPAVAMDADGDFVVTWESMDSTTLDHNIVARRFAADGTARDTNEVRINVISGGSAPDVALDANGNFAVTWVNENIYTRRFNADGTARDTVDLNVNTFPLRGDSYFLNSEVAMDADGDVTIVWDNFYGKADGDLGGVSLQRFAGPEDVDLSVVVDDTSDPVQPGADFTYTFVVTNNHPIASSTGVAEIDAMLGVATGIRTTHVLPDGVSLGAFSGDGWTCSQTARTSNRVDCEYSGTLLPTAMTSGQLMLGLEVMAPSARTMETSVAVSDNQFDATVSNNVDTEQTTVRSPDTHPGEPGDPPLAEFSPQVGVAPGTVVTSNVITITGIDAPADIEITGIAESAYSIDGGPFTGESGTVRPGAQVTVRQTAWSEPSTTTNAVLVIGGTIRTFSVTTASTANGGEAPASSDDPSNCDGCTANDSQSGGGGGGGFGWLELLWLALVFGVRRCIR